MRDDASAISRENSSAFVERMDHSNIFAARSLALALAMRKTRPMLKPFVVVLVPLVTSLVSAEKRADPSHLFSFCSSVRNESDFLLDRIYLFGVRRESQPAFLFSFDQYLLVFITRRKSWQIFCRTNIFVRRSSSMILSKNRPSPSTGKCITASERAIERVQVNYFFFLSLSSSLSFCSISIRRRRILTIESVVQPTLTCPPLFLLSSDRSSKRRI